MKILLLALSLSLLSDTPDDLGPKIPGSQIFHTTQKIIPGSATDFLVKKLIELEGLVKDIEKASPEESKKKDTQIKKLVSGILDLQSLGTRALSTYWEELGKTPKGRADRNQYLKTFKELVEENYLDKARTYVGGKYTIVITGESVSGKETLVSGKVKKTDVDLMLEFHMVSEGGSWKVRDIKLDETTLEETYRSNFNRVIRKKGGLKTGFPELLKVMKNRLEDLRKGRATRL